LIAHTHVCLWNKCLRRVERKRDKTFAKKRMLLYEDGICVCVCAWTWANNKTHFTIALIEMQIFLLIIHWIKLKFQQQQLLLLLLLLLIAVQYWKISFCSYHGSFSFRYVKNYLLRQTKNYSWLIANYVNDDDEKIYTHTHTHTHTDNNILIVNLTQLQKQQLLLLF
jgi:hypothetical protein